MGLAAPKHKRWEQKWWDATTSATLLSHMKFFKSTTFLQILVVYMMGWGPIKILDHDIL
jgi:hypothetical protein